MRRYILLTLLLCITCAGNSQAQYPTLNKLNDFNPDNGVFANMNTCQYAEDSFFIAAGNTLTMGVSPNHIYIAKMGYNGAVQKKMLLYYPGFHNRIEFPNGSLIKTGNDKYLLMGLDWNAEVNPKINVARPFFYYFNSNLDSIQYISTNDSLVTRWPWSCTVDGQKNIIATGKSWYAPLVLNTWNNIYYHNDKCMWIAKYDSNAAPIWEKKILCKPNGGGGG